MMDASEFEAFDYNSPHRFDKGDNFSRRIYLAQIIDLFRHRTRCKKRRCWQCQKDEMWVQEQDLDICSFIVTCESLGMDYKEVRTEFLALPRGLGTFKHNHQATARPYQISEGDDE